MEEKDATFLKRLLATFKDEAAEHISAISSGLVDLERAAPEEQAGIIERVFRESHSMKGAARAVNLSTVETLCQSFEDVLFALKRKQIAIAADTIDVLHRSANVLGELISAVGEKGVFVVPERSRIRDLIRDFGQIMKGVALSASPSALSPAASSELGYEAAAIRPGAQMISAGTVRVTKQALDSILFQAEGLLSAKQAAGQRAAELRGIIAKMVSVKEKEVFLTEVWPGIQNSLADLGKALEQDRRVLAGMVDGLMDEVKQISMLPFSSVLDLMPKVVRDLAHDQGKDAALTISGDQIEIDRRVLDEIREPLIHLLRNSIDHGIEKPAARTAKNKDPMGSIKIDIVQKEGKSVEVVVSDDGAGIDIDKVRDSAVRLGAVTPEEAGKAGGRELLPFIFRSGVTTSPIITDISGRGLGLAIVQEKVDKLGGAVFCEQAGGRTAFRLLLPLTLSTSRGVLVRAAGQSFILPSTGFDRAVRIKRDDISTVENRETVFIDGQAVPILPLWKVLEMPGPGKGTPELVFLQAAVLGTAGHRIAFAVEEVLHEQEILVKDLGKQLARVRNVLGAAVLGTGQVATVLNISDLLKSALKAAPEKIIAAPGETGAVPVVKKSILVAEDSITARTLLKNILEAAGYDVKTAVDGIDAFTMLRTGQFDLVASDVDMPRMNGLELTAKIRQDKRLSNLPVVLITALESREDRERGIEVGANAYIVKSSFDQSNLLEVIKRLL